MITTNSGLICSSRLFLVLLASLLNVIIATNRFNLNFAYVSILDDLKWNKNIQSQQVAAYYYTLSSSLILGGWIADTKSSTFAIASGSFMVGIGSIIIPIVAYQSPYAVIVLRLLQGLGNGALLPGLYKLVQNWSAENEKQLSYSIAVSGDIIGISLAYLVASVFCNLINWQSLFYFTGSVALFFSLIFIIFIKDNPTKCHWVSKNEKKLLQNAANKINNNSETKIKIPWKNIAKCRSVWAMCIACITINFTYYGIILAIPMYMKEIMHLDVTNNGLVSSLPTIIAFLSAFGYGQFFHIMLRKNFGLNCLRKIGHSISCLSCVICLLILAIIPNLSPHLNIALFVTAAGLTGVSSGGGCSNAGLDFAGQYNGILVAMYMMCAHSTGFLAPTVIGYLTPNGTRNEWNAIFYICAAIELFSCAIFALFWNSNVSLDKQKPIEKLKRGNIEEPNKIGKV